MDLADRQGTAAILLLIFFVPLPILILLGNVFVTGWAYVLGVQDVHASVWGWLSEQRDNGTWRIGKIVPLYFLGVVTAYLAYQLLELVAGAFSMFKEALA